MKKALSFIFILLILASCSKTNRSALPEGYYFANKNYDIYCFEKEYLTIFNLRDSISDKYRINFLSDTIKTNNSYKWEITKNNVLSMISFEDSISLTPFKLRNFKINELNSTTWKLLNTEKEDSINEFIRIGNNEVNFYFKYKDELSARKTFKSDFEGKLFDKFNTFLYPSLIVLVDFNETFLTLLTLSEGNEFISKKIKLERVFPRKIDSFLIGKWLKVSDITNKNRMNYLDYISSNEIKKKDSIKDLLDYSKLEFTKNGEFIRYVVKENQIKQHIYSLDNNSIPGFMFVNNIEFNGQFLQILDFNKDSLKINISPPEFLNTYLKVKHWK